MLEEKRVEIQLEQVETIYGKFLTIKNDIVSNQLKQFSAHQRNDLAMLISFIKEKDTILDIGSHIGTFAIPIANSLNSNVNIFAFEPQPQIYELLEKNIKLNNLEKNITTFNGLVSDKKEEFEFILGNPRNSMTGQFVPIKKERIEDERKKRSITTYVINEMVQRKIITDKVNVIKIDTEGAELNVIKSCFDLIDKNLPIIYGEINIKALNSFKVSPNDIEKNLFSRGYHFFRNVGERNSTNDSFTLGRLKHLRDGGQFFDFVAVHPNSDRYPKDFIFYNHFSFRLKNKLLRTLKNIMVKLGLDKDIIK